MVIELTTFYHSGLKLNIITPATQPEEMTWPVENRHGISDLTCESYSYFIFKIIILRENAIHVILALLYTG